MENKIENKAFLGIEVCERERRIETNTIHLHRVELEFEKHGPECEHVFTGETVEFRVTIKNKSNKEFRNVLFSDPLSRELEFVEGSFRVDGRHERPTLRRNELQYRFRHIREHSEHEITFKVRILGEREDEHGGGSERPGRPERPERPRSTIACC